MVNTIPTTPAEGCGRSDGLQGGMTWRLVPATPPGELLPGSPARALLTHARRVAPGGRAFESGSRRASVRTWPVPRGPSDPPPPAQAPGGPRVQPVPGGRRVSGRRGRRPHQVASASAAHPAHPCSTQRPAWSPGRRRGLPSGAGRIRAPGRALAPFSAAISASSTGFGTSRSSPEVDLADESEAAPERLAERALHRATKVPTPSLRPPRAVSKARTWTENSWLRGSWSPTN